MTALLLTAALAAPSHPPAVYPQPVFPPVVVPAYRPPFGHPHHHPRPLTVEQFARSFVPTPGHHTVWLIHPKTCRPVEVCFNLPHCGRPPKVDWNRYHLEFDFGREEVDIRFRHDGTVDVRY